MSAYFTYYLVLIISLLSYYGIGHVFSTLLKLPIREEGSLFRSLTKVITGLIILVIVSTIIITKGKTLAIAIVPFIISLLLILKSKRKENQPIKTVSKIEIKSILYLLITATVVFFFALDNYLINGIHNSLRLNADYNFYAQISSFIGKHGVETPNYDFIYPNLSYPFPYHYGMIWMNASIAKLTGINYSVSLYLVTIPALLTIAALSASTLIKTIFPNKKYIYLAGILFIIFAPFAIFNFGISSVTTFSLKNNLTTAPKVILVFVLYIYALICWLRQYKTVSLIIFSITGVFYFIAYPALMVAIGITSLYLLWKRMLSKREVQLIISAIVLSLAYTGAFYYFTRQEAAQIVNNTSAISYLVENNFRPALSLTARFAANLLIRISPFLLIGIFIYKGKLRKIALHPISIFTAVMLITSVGLSCYMVQNIDVDQFITRSSTPLLTIFCFIITIKALYEKKYFIKIAAVALILVQFIPNINPLFAYWGDTYYADKKIVNYIKESTDYSKYKQKIHIATLNDDKYYRYIFKENTRTFVPFGYLQLITDTFICSPLDLDTFDNKIVTDPFFFNTRSFYKYVNKQKDNNIISSKEQYQVSFINDKDVDFLVWSDSTNINPAVSKMIDSSSIVKSTVLDHNERLYYIAKVKR